MDLQAIADDVWLITGELFQGAKPPLDLPITVYYEPPPNNMPDHRLPITGLDNWQNPAEIRIGITASGQYWGQFVYQLAHELGHVMLDPRRSNGVTETLCGALAYDVLDRMADRWEKTVPLPYMKGWGVNFRTYRINDEKRHLAAVPEVRTAVIRHDWKAVRRYLYLHRSEQAQLAPAAIESKLGRAIQALGAISLRSTGPVRWNEFVGIAARCSSVPLSKEPNLVICPFDASCLKSVSGALCPIGIGCKSRLHW